MPTYARIEDGVVAEVIGPLLYDDGSEIPIGIRFPPYVLEALVDVTNENPIPSSWWTYDGESFYPPV
ncbi:hypothetical protein D3C71_1698110 [compost metagenome]